ncbi:hypothetical protein CGZ69_33045 [Streptomyces peucetius subsp. caesius ATCC 27952]|nr:hypothetical protein CGZ69_33045 [Streptomyces peucetius subsp. caesius ATCC 27952]
MRRKAPEWPQAGAVLTGKLSFAETALALTDPVTASDASPNLSSGRRSVMMPSVRNRTPPRA